MEEIASLIVELLKKHSRVSLPGMGAFIASPQAAAIDTEKRAIVPPSKKITFSKSETWNDGLLEQLYAERHRLDAEAARDKLRHLISDIRFELDSTGKVSLPGLGTLKQASARDINFGLNKNVNLQGDSFGLSDVKVDAIENLPGETEKEKTMATKSKKNIPLLILLGAIALVIVGLLLFFALSGGRGSDELIAPSAGPSTEEVVQELIEEQLSESEGVMPPEQRKEAEQQPAAKPQPSAPEKAQPAKPQAAPKPQPAKQQAAAKPQPAKPQAAKPQAAKQPAAKAEPAKAPATPKCKYCIVAASFGTLDAAKQKAGELKGQGYKAEVVDSGNSRYRVALGCYPTRDQAKQEQAKMQKSYKDAWTLEVCK